MAQFGEEEPIEGSVMFSSPLDRFRLPVLTRSTQAAALDGRGALSYLFPAPVDLWRTC